MEGERPTERELRELAAYADGSLDPARSAELADRITSSPALSRLLDDQLTALRQVRAATVPAPESLRAAIEAQRRAARPPRRVPRLAGAGALAIAVAAAVVALLLALPGSGAPTVAQAAALASRGAVQGPPAPDPANRRLVAPAVDGVHYPYWEDVFGWRARGARDDRLGDHQAVTVYYSDSQNRWVAYTIAGGGPLSVPAAAHRYTIDGTRFAALSAGSRMIVTWLRDGHTCVLSGVGVSTATLRQLAAAS
jgi:ferric-dicitrate binding protein FerR (iron transport regulator)